MKFILSNEYDKKRAEVYFNKLIDAQSNIELKKFSKGRSVSQNAYLHVCITLYAIEFGSTLNEAKTDLKRMCEFMRYEKNGNHYLKETSKMDSKELTDFIEWIRNHSANQGCYIPTSEEYIQNKFFIDKDIESYQHFL